MQSLVVVLRLLHIIGGAVWVGAVVFTAFFLMPGISAAGPAGGAVMRELGQRKISEVMMSLMAVTVLSGVGLMGVIASRSDGTWFSSPMGRVISLGAAMALIAAVYGVVVNRPTALRMQKLGAEMQNSGQPTPTQAAEMKELQAKMLRASRIVAVMLLLAVAAMAAARYV